MTLSGDTLQQTARDTAMALGEVSSGRPFAPHLDVWKVRDKVFLIITEDQPDQQIITVKADPNHADALRRDFDTITPGHYLDKRHWISVASGPGITKRFIENLVQDSYDLAFGRRAEERS
ncbi:MmcQ/YjbR family DNA-binding protein [Arthrobacter sp. OV608]|uniref:MmcQ/YjbR family DNA-binding protein n=1 Tax=Arthrobacter sp. OV608 TaxID=1882768 RepID=UPI0008C8F7AF|nr:MmcQ/YjbR family DNA-binding protein [Arthrobacter sp. OV608]SEQ70412.1 Predicted DNA-binding protein, MmcQ/YjbR family [Arthrobacter sp. OV608]